MKTIFSLIFTFWIVPIISGQVAIIQDPDGWANVRKLPNSNAEVVYKIKENKVFWYDPDWEGKHKDWVLIYIPKNNYSLESCGGNLIEGYIHKSRLLILERMRKYKGEDISFNYVLKNCDLTNRNVDRLEGRWVERIDGREFYGTDGPIPKLEVERIEAKIFGEEIDIHEIFYADIFECDNSFDVYRNGDTFFVHQWNSDGAGAYEVVWVLDRHGLKQRIVGTIL